MKPGKKSPQSWHAHAGMTKSDNATDVDAHGRRKSLPVAHDLDEKDDDLTDTTTSFANKKQGENDDSEQINEDEEEENGGNSGESFGKRKVDDFLRREEIKMDPKFKPFVVLPGDNVTATSTRITKNIRLGPGLVQRGECVIATRAGMLRYRPPCSYWVESNGRRYFARAEDQVLGIIEDRIGDSYKVSIFGSSPALLGMLEFDGASKLNKPNLKNGALVFCRVATADKDMEVELTCTSTHHGSRKGWMTGQSTFGELKGGKMQRCSLLLAKSLVRPDCRVLCSLGRHVPFEIATGLNGAFWVDSGSEAETIVVCNAILNSEMMTDEQTDAMVDKLASHLKEPIPTSDGT